MGEAKIFECDGVVVTTERVIYGGKIVPLDDISGGALPNAMLPWGSFAATALLGLVMLICGFPALSSGWTLLGFS